MNNRMNTSIKLILPLAALSLGFSLVGAASNSLSKTDQNFAATAALGNAFEARFGMLPAKQGGSVDVRAFGEMLSKDHAAAQPS